MDSNLARKAQDMYRANQVQTATREQLLLLTYDIGIRACHGAIEAMGRSDIEGANDNLKRAQAVVRELMVTLNLEQGGEVARSLMGLYDFFYNRLVEANVKKDPSLVREVLGMLEELRKTWAEAIEKLKSEQSPPAQGGVSQRKAPDKVESYSGAPGGVNIAG
ncbi:flagellar biosynthetic protein FliS [Thermanaerovibrio velox DSM 12556]|uniref:Flagellar biosynthetic protein FliS n=1 Tax=Thermanaerovibrio velox DSM 12556 TaxID=926567 RepID=H0URA0_9BACT|nr:flagellar export chaperone FliS [Thermanaerovibrio velox]EHM09856.1 flagellar biosynthetic protein FliS [Thermanaerovibrio velox DSM 12556]